MKPGYVNPTFQRFFSRIRLAPGQEDKGFVTHPNIDEENLL
jgi:hypothetical protein